MPHAENRIPSTRNFVLLPHFRTWYERASQTLRAYTTAELQHLVAGCRRILDKIAAARDSWRRGPVSLVCCASATAMTAHEPCKWTSFVLESTPPLQRRSSQLVTATGKRDRAGRAYPQRERRLQEEAQKLMPEIEPHIASLCALNAPPRDLYAAVSELS